MNNETSQQQVGHSFYHVNANYCHTDTGIYDECICHAIVSLFSTLNFLFFFVIPSLYLHFRNILRKRIQYCILSYICHHRHVRQNRL